MTEEVEDTVPRTVLVQPADVTDTDANCVTNADGTDEQTEKEKEEMELIELLKSEKVVEYKNGKRFNIKSGRFGNEDNLCLTIIRLLDGSLYECYSPLKNPEHGRFLLKGKTFEQIRFVLSASLREALMVPYDHAVMNILIEVGDQDPEDVDVMDMIQYTTSEHMVHALKVWNPSDSNYPMMKTGQANFAFSNYASRMFSRSGLYELACEIFTFVSEKDKKQFRCKTVTLGRGTTNMYVYNHDEILKIKKMTEGHMPYSPVTVAA